MEVGKGDRLGEEDEWNEGRRRRWEWEEKGKRRV